MNEFIHEVEWTKKHILKCYTKEISTDVEPMSADELESIEVDNIEEREDIEKNVWIIQELRKDIEPWLTSIFQSEHFSLLLGSGLTIAITNISGTNNIDMSRIEFEDKFKELISSYSDRLAIESKRVNANIEDDFNAAFRLLEGYDILGDEEQYKILRAQINNRLATFIQNISDTEKSFINKSDKEKREEALRKLQSFLISFSARITSRERLNIFTTNYDRFIEFGLDTAGILSLDRFVGKIRPKLRTTKLDLDFHYNPPGIRGEPRYVEGVIRLTKLHGSIDWQFDADDIIRTNTQFGETDFINKNESESLPLKDLGRVNTN